MTAGPYPRAAAGARTGGRSINQQPNPPGTDPGTDDSEARYDQVACDDVSPGARPRDRHRFGHRHGRTGARSGNGATTRSHGRILGPTMLAFDPPARRERFSVPDLPCVIFARRNHQGAQSAQRRVSGPASAFARAGAGAPSFDPAQIIRSAAPWHVVCPRAWPAPGPLGSCVPPRPDPEEAAAGQASPTAMDRCRRAGPVRSAQ